MAEDEKKKKKGSEAEATPTAPGANPSPPIGDDEVIDYDAMILGAMKGDGEDASATPEDPEVSWFDRITGTLAEVPSSIGRGAIKAIDEVGNTIAIGAAHFDRATGIGEALTPGFNAAFDEHGARGMIDAEGGKETIEKVFGKRSDNLVAGFAESVSQFATSFIALGQLRVGRWGMKVADFGAKAAAARGAVVDATGFDPYEAQLAELVARSPVPIAKELGQMLSVDGDDGELVARLKRAGAGLITGGMIDGLVAVARAVRGGRRLASGEVKGAEKEALEAEVLKNEQIVQDFADGTHKSADDAFTVEKAGDGEVKLTVNPENEAVKALGWADGEGPRELIFEHRATAEAAAASMNMSANQRFIASKGIHINGVEAFTQKLTETLRMLSAGADGTSADEFGKTLKQLIDEDGHFNVSYYTEPADALTAITTISKSFKDAIDAAQARGQNVEDIVNSARRIIGALDESSAPRFFATKLGQMNSMAAELLAGDVYMRLLGKRVADLAVAYEGRPGDALLLKEASTAIGNLLNIQKLKAGADSEVGRTLRVLQERENVGLRGAKLGDKIKKVLGKPAEVTTDEKLVGKNLEGADALAKKVAGMDTRSIESILRAARLSDGNVGNLYALGRLAQVHVHKGKGQKFMEVFYSNLLSRPVTAMTQMTSGLTVGSFEAFGRLVGGIGSRNSELAQEGIDMLWAHARHMHENVHSAWAALKAGHSVINPRAVHQADWSDLWGKRYDGRVGAFVRKLMPTNWIQGMDEFVKVSNYRARIRAKSLRLGRRAGLSGSALEQYVEADLRASFDEATGIALVPDALRFGEMVAMSEPLTGNFSRNFQELTNASFPVKFIAPFVKAPINMFNYARAHTPLLNRQTEIYRRAMEAGGEEMAALQAKTALASSMYVLGAMYAMTGNLTGRGPSDPKLRKMWLADDKHRPYSIKVGGKWISYKRTDPMGLPMSIIADALTFYQEAQTAGEQTEANDLIVAGLASLTSALGSRTYLQGLTETFKAWGTGDEVSARLWMQRALGSVTVPGIVDASNPDPYFREVQGFADAIAAKVPGWSETLDPKYDLFGEPVMRAGAIQRTFNPFVFADAPDYSLEDQLRDIGRSFPTPRREEFGGRINLSDKKWDTRGVGKSPYARWMELVSQSSIREDVKRLISTDAFKRLSNGTNDWKGGQQYDRVNGIIVRHYDAAERRMLSEYPELARARMLLTREKGIAERGGESAVEQFQSLFPR